jgi:hypothetical protein
LKMLKDLNMISQKQFRIEVKAILELYLTCWYKNIVIVQFTCSSKYKPKNLISYQ